MTGGKALPGEVLDADPRQDRRRAAVRRGADQDRARSRASCDDAGDRYELSGPLPPLAIPATLQDSLMARLDRLAPVKEVAQIGACIGREFSHELLAAVSPLPAAELERRARATGRQRAGVPTRQRRRRRSTASSTRWCRTRPTRACSRAGGSSTTRGSRGRSSRSFRSWRSASRSWWRTTSPRQAFTARRFPTGTWRASALLCARLTRKRLRISTKASPRSLTCQTVLSVLSKSSTCRRGLGHRS